MEIKEKIALLTKDGKLEWKKHALQRIFEREITRDEVKQAILNGKIIEDYSDDYPYPSVLIAYVDKNKPMHVLVAYDESAEISYIITAYKPDTKYFEADLITRKKDGKR